MLDISFWSNPWLRLYRGDELYPFTPTRSRVREFSRGVSLWSSLTTPATSSPSSSSSLFSTTQGRILRIPTYLEVVEGERRAQSQPASFSLPRRALTTANEGTAKQENQNVARDDQRRADGEERTVVEENHRESFAS